MKQNEIQNWLLGFFSKSSDLSKYDRDSLINCNYFDEELIDSMGVINLIVSLEQELSIKLDNDVFQDRRFVTIAGLSEIVSELKTDNSLLDNLYTKDDVSVALADCGIGAGDTIFCHSNVGFWGVIKDVHSNDETCALIYEAILDVIGDTGTLVVPTFTYSFGNDKQNKRFDVTNTPSNMGIFAEYIRKLPDSVRSYDPMFSVSAIGKNSEKLITDLSDECFGKNSFWARLHAIDGKICNFNFDSGSTFIHYVEKQLEVPYRKDYEFSGTLVTPDGVAKEKTVIFFCRDLENSDASAKFERFDILARNQFSKTSEVGRGEVLVITAQETFDLVKATLPIEPNFLNASG